MLNLNACNLSLGVASSSHMTTRLGHSLLLTVAFLLVCVAAHTQARSGAQDPTLNHMQHEANTATTPPGTLGRVDKSGQGPRPVLLLAVLGFGGSIWSDFSKRHVHDFTTDAGTLAGFGGTDRHPRPVVTEAQPPAGAVPVARGTSRTRNFQPTHGRSRSP